MTGESLHSSGLTMGSSSPRIYGLLIGKTRYTPLNGHYSRDDICDMIMSGKEGIGKVMGGDSRAR